MSERVRFTDGEDNELDANPENTAMYRYRKIGALGVRLSMYDHVYIIDEEAGTGSYIFIDNYGEGYVEALTDAMIEDGYTVMHNLDTVAQCDIDAYDAFVIKPQLRSIEDGVPGDWM